MNSDGVVTFLLVIACLIGIVVGAIYISEHMTCFNFFGMAKGCVVGK
jgi:uncharacterized membrane protein